MSAPIPTRQSELNAIVPRQRIGRYRWIVCALLFWSTTINYLDQQILSVLQPQLSETFNWSHSDYANITAVFQLSYALSMLFAGGFIDKVGTKRGYAWILVLWTLGTMLHAFALPMGEAFAPVLAWAGWSVPASVAGFMLARLILGAGLSGNFPAGIKTTAEWFPQRERSLANGVFDAGCNMGAMLAPLAVPWVAMLVGRQWTFILIAAVGLVWLFFWKRFYDAPAAVLAQGRLNLTEYAYIETGGTDAITTETLPLRTKHTVRWLSLLKYRQTWVFVVGKFITDGVWWFFLFWLPSYLDSHYHIRGTAATLPLTVVYALSMIGSVGGGWFPEYFIRKGKNGYEARMAAMRLIALCALPVLFTPLLSDYGLWLPILFIGLGAAAHQAWSANIFTLVPDLFPQKIVASVTGIGGMAGGIGGMLLSKSSGWIFDYFDAQGCLETGYAILFGFCALAYLVAWLLMHRMLPHFQPFAIK